MRTARDLLLRLPRAYEDLRRVTPVAALAGVPDGTAVLVRGVVRRLHIFPRRLLDVVVDDEGATVRARWFRAPGGMARAFPKGGAVAVAGALHTARDGTRELLQPSVVTAALLARGGAGLGIRPRYAQIPGVPGRTLERVRDGGSGGGRGRRGRGSGARCRRCAGSVCRRLPRRCGRCTRLPTISRRRRRPAGACCSSARSWRSWLFWRNGQRTPARPGRVTARPARRGAVPGRRGSAVPADGRAGPRRRRDRGRSGNGWAVPCGGC